MVNINFLSAQNSFFKEVNTTKSAKTCVVQFLYRFLQHGNNNNSTVLVGAKDVVVKFAQQQQQSSQTLLLCVGFTTIATTAKCLSCGLFSTFCASNLELLHGA